MTIQSIQKVSQGNNPATNTMTFAELKNYLDSASYNDMVASDIKKFNDQADKSIGQLQAQVDKTPAGPNKTALQGAVKALETKKALMDSLFKDVITYSVVGMWQMASTNMNNIDATQGCQNHMMSLNEMVEQQAEAASNSFTAAGTGTLSQDLLRIQMCIAAGGDSESENVNAATTQFNMDNTVMSSLGTFYSGVNNLLNNGISSVSQNISVDLSNLTQGFQKYCDLISQSIQTVY